MLGTAHAPLGAAAGVITIHLLELAGWRIPGTETISEIIAATLGAVCGLAPDIDAPTASIANPSRGIARGVRRTMGLRRHSGAAMLLILASRLLDLPVRFVSRRIQSWLGHRGATHSLGAMLLFSLNILIITLITNAQYWELSIIAMAGYLSHLLADGLTYGGQPLYWPLDHQRRWLIPAPLRVSAKSLFANAGLSLISMTILLVSWLPLIPRPLAGNWIVTHKLIHMHHLARDQQKEITMYVHPSVFTDPANQAGRLVKEILGLEGLPTWKQVNEALQGNERLGVLLSWDTALIVEDKERDWDGTVAPFANRQARFFALRPELVSRTQRNQIETPRE